MNTLTKGTKGAASTNAPKQSIQQIVSFWLSVMPEGMTRRELSKQSGLEIVTLCGALDAMQKKGTAHVNRTTTCPTTGREVAVYQLGVTYEVFNEGTYFCQGQAQAQVPGLRRNQD